MLREPSPPPYRNPASPWPTGHSWLGQYWAADPAQADFLSLKLGFENRVWITLPWPLMRSRHIIERQKLKFIENTCLPLRAWNRHLESSRNKRSFKSKEGKAESQYSSITVRANWCTTEFHEILLLLHQYTYYLTITTRHHRHCRHFLQLCKATDHTLGALLGQALVVFFLRMYLHQKSLATPVKPTSNRLSCHHLCCVGFTTTCNCGPSNPTRALWTVGVPTELHFLEEDTCSLSIYGGILRGK